MIIFKICDIKFRNLGNNCNTDEIHDQTMKFGQLIEYNMRNFFLKNHSQNVVEKLFQDAFLNKSKLSISLD